jgi:23S rRNA (pseudouridine1915-N3)-methyltransferase
LKLWVIAVGRPGKLLVDAIADYERRASRYWNLEVIEVREERAAKSVPLERVREAESSRLLERVPAGTRIFALTRGGAAWNSSQLAEQLQQLAVEAAPGAAFLIGGAFGLSDELLRRADRTLQLSSFTLPHELARLMLAEQLYRAGTIARGEPYHKAVK